jgi:hypothetical protein
VTSKKQAGVVVAGLGILICLMYLFGIEFIKAESAIDLTIWDFNTATAGDFTIELKISDKQWRTYLDVHQVDEDFFSSNLPDISHSRLLKFKRYLSKQLLEKLNNYPKVIEDDTDLQIANINFAYKNADLLKLLSKRGALIISGKYS